MLLAYMLLAYILIGLFIFGIAIALVPEDDFELKDDGVPVLLVILWPLVLGYLIGYLAKDED